jgi:hypothetical protein
MRLLRHCPRCNKILKEIQAFSISDTKSLKFYECGHFFISEIKGKIPIKTESWDGKFKARPYQIEGIDFIVNPPEGNQSFNCILGDQQRLGKTPQSLLALYSCYNERTPCLILVRQGNIYQWVREYKRIVDPNLNGIFIIEGSKKFIFPGFKTYIMSMDTLSRGDMVNKLLKFGFKLVIVDECHSFKNPGSKRSQALIQFLYEISKSTKVLEVPFVCTNCGKTFNETIQINESVHNKNVAHRAYCPACNALNIHYSHLEKIQIERKCGVIMLSGTVIKNRADEFFVPLNIVAPEKFPSLKYFRERYLTQDEKGKWSRVSRWYIEDFKNSIKPFFLRREKEDVYEDLPKLNKTFTLIEVSDDMLVKAYNHVLDEIEENYVKSNLNLFNTLAELTKLRQICGLAKRQWTVDFIENKFESTEKENSKLAIGLHHHELRNLLYDDLQKYGVDSLSGKDQNKDFIVRNFETNSKRILLINMLAGGLGLSIPFIDDIIVLERQWNYVDEEQFEYRFYNPDKSIKDRPTYIEYIVCKDTIDEFFYDLVEEKKLIYGETLSTNWYLSQDVDSIKKLIERTLGSRLKTSI